MQTGQPDPFAKLAPEERQRVAQQLRAMLAEQRSGGHPEPIAIIGMSCRLPKAEEGPESYWRSLRDGVDSMTEAPSDRWDVAQYYDPDQDAPGKTYTRCFGLLERVAEFDARFFGISPREARQMDPQQRLLLEMAWESLESACQPPDQLFGSATGVFVGLSCQDYFGMQFGRSQIPFLDSYSGTGCNSSVAAGRLSYFLGTQGPAMVVDTACSSSLVAVHLAAASLRNNECNLALAGGVNLLLSPAITIAFCRARMLAPNGPCRTFDKDANGYMRGEGAGMVVLKRLSSALANGDSILALIRGTAINHDGRSSGLTAPNGPAQQDVIRRALANGGVSPDEVGYVEAHGTGTPLGDPIELQAAAAALGTGRAADNPLVVGSAKANIGHTEAAAGIAGILKVVLSLQNEAIPPQLHFRELNPNVAVGNVPFVIPTELRPWPRGTRRRIAGVSSFGFSGTNAHVLIEESPAHGPLPAAAHDRTAHVLALSARSEASVRRLAERFATFLETHPQTPHADVCFSANAGRSHFEHRIAVAADSPEKLRQTLVAVAAGASPDGARIGLGANEPRIGFAFTGQGAQYRGMGRELYACEPVFAATLDRCEAAIGGELGRPLLPVMFGDDLEADLDDTRYTQPALVALELALSELWKSWGIRPTRVIGHSLGEYTAAIVAGVMTLEDGLQLVARRAALVSALPRGGEMVAVMASEERVAAALAPFGADLAIASVNGPEQVVVSGASGSMAQLVDRLNADGVVTRPVTTSHAFHSPLLDPMLDAFTEAASQVKFSPPRLGLVSNLTGAVVGREVCDPLYWRRHLREPVRFADGLRTLVDSGCNTLVEIGPHPTLLNIGRRWFPSGAVAHWLPSMQRGNPESLVLMDSLGALYTAGASVAWGDVDKGRGRARVALPTYAFDRKRYWLEEGPTDVPAALPADPWPVIVSRSASAARTLLQASPAPVPPDADPVEALSCAYIAAALGQLGLFRAPVPRGSAAAREHAGILPQYEQLTARWMELVARRGYLSIDGDTYVDGRQPAAEELAQAMDALGRAVADQPHLAGWSTSPLEILRRCGEQLPQTLTGGGDPLGAVFGGDYFAVANGFYRDSPDARRYNALAAEVLAGVVAARPAHARLRVLEIGGGSGGITTSLLPVLPADRTTYLFTDLSNGFFASAREKFAAYPFVEYGVLDASRDPTAQRLAPGSFDLVIASNVLHATPAIRATLANVRSLVAPGGFLLLNEVTEARTWYDLLFGPLLAPFEEDGVRIAEHLLTPDEWSAALAQAGFQRVAAFPAPGVGEPRPYWSIVLAQAPTTAGALEPVGPPGSTEPKPIPIAPPASQPGAPDRVEQLAREVREADPSTRRPHLESYLRELLARTLAIDPAEVTLATDFAELGMDSLMTMELVQRLKRDVDLTLPAAALVQARTVQHLSRVLSRSTGASDSPLIELQPGRQRTLHLVHPSGGGVLCYLDLARRLGAERPVRAFQARGLLDGAAPERDLVRMAADYTRLLRERQPEGPYLVGGWSMGGVVAFEIANQLQAAGQEVSLVALIDSWLPTDVSWPTTEAGLAAWFMRDLAGLEGVQVAAGLEQQLPADPDKHVGFVLDRLKDLHALPAIVRPEQVKPLFEVFKANLRALAGYRPAACAAPVVLFRASQALEFGHATEGWGTVAPNLRISDLPGTHYQVMRPPELDALAAALNKELQALD
jgi:acyl transferase domain-containing protein/thioesterase domain-containing protein/acyl carrier protein/SAM-dependent methyltransferase